MLIEPTIEKLIELKLSAMRRAWEEQRKDPDIQELGFDERFALLVDAEWIERQNKRMTTRLREAKLRISSACLEDTEPRGDLSRKRLRELATCAWIEAHHNIAITGATGVGKTYVACALAQQACRKGYRALYRRAPRLLDEIALSRADGSYPRFLTRVARMDVLVIDDWGLITVGDRERRELLEIMEDRYGQRSTVLCSQLPVEQWHDHLGDPTIADAICDRLLHNAHRIMLEGDSRRRSTKPD